MVRLISATTGRIREFTEHNPAPSLIVAYIILWTLEVRYNVVSLSLLTRVFFVYSIAPVCLYYILYRYGSVFLWLWQTNAGKIIYVLSSAALIAFCRSLADRVISSTLQTSANQLPNAQNCLTLYFLVSFIVGIAGEFMKATYFIAVSIIVLLVINVGVFNFLLQEIVAANPDLKEWRVVRNVLRVASSLSFERACVLFIDALVFLISGAFVAQIPIIIDRSSWIKDEMGWPVSMTEELLLLSSFYPNSVSENVLTNGKRLVCANLPSDVYVALVDPDNVVPHDVIVAEVRRGLRAAQENAYTYRLAVCENTNDPDHVRGSE